MAASARIDELRSKFDENPRRYFAPLANEYRKAGDLETAIAICRTQLRQFPTHMSGHVVLGQALYEAGELPEARQVFERAVELDPENLIALRHLGDIARATGEPAAATSWYRRILDADPYNEQIAALVAETTAAAAPAPDAPSVDSAAPVEAPAPAFRAPEVEIHDGPPPASADVEFIDLSADDFRWAPPTPSTAPESPAEAAAEAHALAAEAPPEPSVPTDAPAEAAAGFEATSFEFVDEWVGELPDAAAPTEELAVAGASPEPGVAAVEASVADDAPAGEAPFDPVVGLDLVPVHDAADETLDRAAPPAAEPWPSEETAALDLVTSGAFATETMAELCLEQGHEEEALAIFERLLAQRPGDAALAGRVEALRVRLRAAEAGAPSAGAFLRDLAERRVDEPLPDTPAAATVPDAVGAETADHPVLDAAPVPEPTVDAGAAEQPVPEAESLVEPEAGPEAEPEAEPQVEPQQAPMLETAPELLIPARDAWAANALRDAFRDTGVAGPRLMDEVAARAAADRLHTPVAEAPAAPAPSEPVVDLSFDRFFAGLEPAERDAPMPDAAEWREESPLVLAPAEPEAPRAAPAPAPTPTPEPEPAADTEDDLAEFNAWLRGLRDS